MKFPDALPKSLLRESVRGRLPDELLDRTDKTFFNDFALRTADYEGIRRLALASELRIEGVDYALLAERVEARDLDVVELLWAYDLARAHAFLELGSVTAQGPATASASARRSRSPTCARAAATRSRWPRPTSTGPAPGDRLLLEWRATPELPLDAELHSDGQGFRLRIADAGWFSVEPEAGRIEAPADGGLRTEERLWGIPALLCFRARGDLPLHAAAVETGQGAVLVAAPRTYGKTTMAAAFHRAGCRVLSEDTSCVRLGAGAAIVPGPAMLRVRRDVAGRLELPAPACSARTTSAPTTRWTTPGTASRCRSARSSSSTCAADAALEPVEQPEAIRDLWALSFRLPTEEDVGRSFAGVADLAAAVPAFRLRRPLDLDRLDDHVALVLADV